MIIKERNGDFIKTWSDKNVYIHGGDPEGNYVEAIDLIDREYLETDIPIFNAEEELNEWKEIAEILLGQIE